MSASQQIVVGVDGSPSSIQALKWAIGQAALTGASIEAVAAWHFPNSHGAPLPDTGDYPVLAAETLDKAIAAARNASTGPGEADVTITSYVGEDPPRRSCSTAVVTPGCWWWAAGGTEA